MPRRSADFIDEQSAFVVQKGIYEYSRARAGHYAKVLFAEQEFADAVEQVALARLSARARHGRRSWSKACCGRMRGTAVQLLDALGRAGRSPSSTAIRFPPSLGRGGLGRRCARELVRRLQLIGLHPPKRAIDIPEPFAEAYFDLMPIHEKLRGSDFPTIAQLPAGDAVQHP